MLWLLLALALADEPVEADSVPDALLDAAPTPTARLVDDARARIHSRDWPGARALLVQAGLRDDVDREEVAYLHALVLHREERTAEALAALDAHRATWPDGARADDVTFLRAVDLADLGRPAAAITALDALGDLDAREEVDRLKVDLLRGEWEIRLGNEREGIRRITAALAAAGGRVPWYEARARTALAERLVEQADALPLTGGGKRQARRLAQRARLVKAVEEQVTLVARLDEVEWTLEGLILLGRGYERIGDALLEAPPPRRLNGDRAAIYRDTLAKQVIAVWTKAWRHYASGLDLAARLGVDDRRVARLREHHRALGARIEAGQ